MLFANRAEAEMFGFDDPEQMIGTPINNLIAPEDLERLTGYRMARLRGEPAVTRYEFRGLRVDGSPVWIEALVDAIPWGDETAIQAVHIDITERKRAEEALKKSESHLASILDTAGDGIVTMDDACIVQSFNKAAEHIFGYSAHDVIGRNVNVLMPPEIADVHNGFIDRYLQTGETEIIGVGRELTGRRKDGSTFPLFLNVSEVRDGDRVTFTGILRDISELKRAEQQLIEANQAKSRFLSHMSHELRNPLSAILGFTQLLKRDPTLGEEHLNDMRIIHSSAEHLLELINDVLDISKIEAGMETVQEEEFDLYLNLEGLMDMFSVRATVKGLTLEMDVQADVPQYVRGDRRKVRQVLINLIGNAIKFTDQGGVRLEVSRGVEGIRFKVKDTGAGISNEDLNHIFEPFHQADRTAAAGGTGLGLPISKNFVELMGGQLTVDSRENEGSVFAFSLPLKALGEETVPRPEDHKTITGLADHRDWRILIVDDERVNRKFLKNLLERTGFTTQEAVNGSEAINQFEEFSPHLILMDVRMPIMDGLEAARRIREMENEGRIAIIALTANAFVRNEREFIRAGCDSVISKPFDAGDLLLSVGKLLQIEFTYDESPADNLAG